MLWALVVYIFALIVTNGEAIIIAFFIIPFSALFNVLNVDIFHISSETISYKPIFNPFEKRKTIKIEDIQEVLVYPKMGRGFSSFVFHVAGNKVAVHSKMARSERRKFIEACKQRGVQADEVTFY